MEKTAVEWLYNKMLYIDNEYDMKLITKSEYQFKRRDIIEQAKEMEAKQRKNDFRAGWHGNKHKDWNCEFYLIKHINNDFKSE